MVKRSIEQEIRNKNFGIRNGKFEKNAVVKNQWTKQRVQRVGNGSPTGSVLKETIAVSATISTAWKSDTVEYVSEFFHAAE